MSDNEIIELTLRINKDILERVRDHAKKEHRSTNRQLCVYIELGVKKKISLYSD